MEENFAAHDKLFPNQPKMCMEMWDGWFDAWGDNKHHVTSAEAYASVVEDMLKKGQPEYVYIYRWYKLRFYLRCKSLFGHKISK